MAGATTQADRQSQVLAAGYNGPLTDAAINQAYANAATPGDLASSGLSDTPSHSQTGSLPASSNSAAAQLGQIQQQMLDAIGSGNKVAADELIRQFNLKYGLDQAAAQEAIRQYNQKFALDQSGVTGTYNGQQTQAAQQQAFSQAIAAAGLTGYFQNPSGQQGGSTVDPSQFYQLSPDQQAPYLQSNATREAAAAKWAHDAGLAQDSAVQAAVVAAGGQPTINGPQGQQTLAGAALSGTYNGAPTEAARQFNMTSGLNALQLASTNQADPFRRLSTQYDLSIHPQYMAGMQAVINGVTGQNGIAQQQATGLSAADSAKLGGLQQSVQQTSGAVPGTPGAGMTDSGGANTGGGTYAQGQATLNGLPAPNQTIARNYATLGPSAKAAYLSAQSAKTGLDPKDIEAQITSTLPKLQAPQFGLATV